MGFLGSTWPALHVWSVDHGEFLMTAAVCAAQPARTLPRTTSA